MVTQAGMAKAKRRQHTEKTPGNERGTSADWNFDKLLEERTRAGQNFSLRAQ